MRIGLCGVSLKSSHTNNIGRLMELKVLDRLVLLSILPKEGDITTIKIARRLREDLSFDEEEHKALDITTKNPDTGEDDGRLHWKRDADIPRDIEIGPKAMSIIRKRFEDLDKQGKLRDEQIDIYDKFMSEIAEV